MRKISIAALAAALLLGLLPAGVSAHDGHCMDIFILSGVAVDDTTLVGTNPGAVSCTANDPDVHPDTNFTVPGAAVFWVGLFDTFAEPRFAEVTVGDGEAVPLTFTLNAVRGRWESQPVDIVGVLPGTPITATVDVVPAGYEGDIPEEFFQTITYTRL